MKVWKALFIKELRLGGPASLTFLMTELIMVLIGGFFAIRDHNYQYIPIIGIMLLFCHGLYLFLYLLVTLNVERKTLHLWLYHPLPGWALLAAKLLAALVSMLVSFVLTASFTLIGIESSDFQVMGFGGKHYIGMDVFTTFFIFWMSLFVGMVFIFLWVLFYCLRSRLGKWAWLITIAIAAAVIFLYSSLENKGQLKSITHWGYLRFQWSTDSYSTIYIGGFVFQSLVVIILFVLSSYLLDRFMEVS
ncbi:MAG: hypothetical protein ACE3JK_08795 [Sporolactobacillus sp.]